MKMMLKKVIGVLCALLIALTAIFAVHPALADSGQGSLYMYVETGNNGKLHLRAGPGSGYESLGLYRSGIPVLVEGFANGDWASVLVDGRRGYMNMRYLTGCALTQADPVSFPAVTERTTLYVRTGNSGRLHLRADASRDAESLGLYLNGTPVCVISRNGAWAFVNVDGATGYMMLNFLTDNASVYSPNQQMNARQQKALNPVFPSGSFSVMYVNTGNTGMLHLRAAARQDAESLGLYANGTQVHALCLGNGWSQVTVGGITGFMLTGCLSPLPPSMHSCSAPQPTAAPYVYRYTPTASPTPRVTYRYWYIQPTAVPQPAVYYPQLPPAPTASPASSLYAGAVLTVRNRNSSFVYLRSSRDSDRRDNILAQVPVGSQVMMLEPGEYWCRVRYGGLEGYMVSGYLQ